MKAAVDAGLSILKEITFPAIGRMRPTPPITTVIDTGPARSCRVYQEYIMHPANAMRGDATPVSAFPMTALFRRDGRL
jgi:hypothetical protein